MYCMYVLYIHTYIQYIPENSQWKYVVSVPQGAEKGAQDKHTWTYRGTSSYKLRETAERANNKPTIHFPSIKDNSP
jgi:hypothetical protein